MTRMVDPPIWFGSEKHINRLHEILFLAYQRGEITIVIRKGTGTERLSPKVLRTETISWCELRFPFDFADDMVECGGERYEVADVVNPDGTRAAVPEPDLRDRDLDGEQSHGSRLPVNQQDKRAPIDLQREALPVQSPPPPRIRKRLAYLPELERCLLSSLQKWPDQSDAVLVQRFRRACAQLVSEGKLTLPQKDRDIIKQVQKWRPKILERLDKAPKRK